MEIEENRLLDLAQIATKRAQIAVDEHLIRAPLCFDDALLLETSDTQGCRSFIELRYVQNHFKEALVSYIERCRSIHVESVSQPDGIVTAPAETPEETPEESTDPEIDTASIELAVALPEEHDTDPAPAEGPIVSTEP